MTKKKLYTFISSALLLTAGSFAAVVSGGSLTQDPGGKENYRPNAPEAPTVVVNAETPSVAVTFTTPVLGTLTDGATQTENQVLPETTEMTIKVYRAESETADGTIVYTIKGGVDATLSFDDVDVTVGNTYYYYLTATDNASNLTSEASPRTAAEVTAPEPVDPNVDVLTAAGFGVEKASSYANFSNVKFNSDAVYAANITKNSNGSIQMRVSDLSKQDASGIITTTSGGCVRKVSLTWDAVALTTSRTLQFFGSHTPYTSIEELYDESTRGDLIKEVTFDFNNPTETTTAEFEITDANYEYIGIRSAKGALFVEDITITWGEAIELPATALYTETAEVHTTYLDSECYAPVATVEVEGFEDYILIKAWAGVEGYDVKIFFDEEENITGIQPVENGVEKDLFEDGYARIFTGLTEGVEFAEVEISRDTAKAFSNPDAKSGYVLLKGYVEDTEDVLVYNITWPALPQAYYDDMDKVDALYTTLDEAVEFINGKYLAFADAEKADAIKNQIDALYNDVEDAGVEYYTTKEYTSPLTEEALKAVNNAIAKYREDVVAAFDVQFAKYKADGETINTLREELDALNVSEEDAAYKAIADKIDALENNCLSAWDTCVNETAEYVSPVTDEAVEEIRAAIKALEATGINALTVEDGAVYFDLNGNKVQNPANTSKVVIRILNGKASKVLVK